MGVTSPRTKRLNRKKKHQRCDKHVFRCFPYPSLAFLKKRQKQGVLNVGSRVRREWVTVLETYEREEYRVRARMSNVEWPPRMCFLDILWCAFEGTFVICRKGSSFAWYQRRLPMSLPPETTLFSHDCR